MKDVAETNLWADLLDDVRDLATHVYELWEERPAENSIYGVVRPSLPWRRKRVRMHRLEGVTINGWGFKFYRTGKPLWVGKDGDHVIIYHGYTSTGWSCDPEDTPHHLRVAKLELRDEERLSVLRDRLLNIESDLECRREYELSGMEARRF